MSVCLYVCVSVRARVRVQVIRNSTADMHPDEEGADEFYATCKLTYLYRVVTVEYVAHMRMRRRASAS